MRSTRTAASALRWLLAMAFTASCSAASPPPPSAEEARDEPREETPPEPAEDPPTAAEVPPEPADPEPAPRRRYAVAVIGDSLTEERSGAFRYVTFLRQRCPESRFENFGRGGDMVNMMRRRFVSDFLPRADEFTHLVVFGGVNDLYSDLTAGRNPANISADLTFMYEGAREHGLGVIALTVAPWGGFTRYYNERRGATTLELNDWIRAARGRGAVDHVVDAYAVLSCGDDPTRLCPEYMYPVRDGLHFGRRGHEVLGEALHREVFSDCL